MRFLGILVLDLVVLFVHPSIERAEGLKCDAFIDRNAEIA